MQPDPSTERTPGGEALELVIFAGDAVLTRPLPPRGQVAIGRAEDNDVRLDHPSVSRRHAILHVGPGLSLEDLGSANGTSLRDSRRTPEDGATQGLIQVAARRVEITPGDTLTFGSVMTVVRRAAPPDEPLPEGDALAPGVVVHHPAMRALYAQATLAARSHLSVLILGETKLVPCDQPLRRALSSRYYDGIRRTARGSQIRGYVDSPRVASGRIADA